MAAQTAEAAQVKNDLPTKSILMHAFHENAHPGEHPAFGASNLISMTLTSGAKRHFTPHQIQDLARILEDAKRYRDLSLLC